MKQQKVSPILVWLAVAASVIYFFISYMSYTELNTQKYISTDEAREAAIHFVQSFQQHHNFQPFVGLQTDKLLASYIHHNKLNETYEQKFADQYPLDYFVVELTNIDDAEQRYLVHIDPKSGNVIGWHQTSGYVDVSQTEKNVDPVKRVIEQFGYQMEDFELVDTQQYDDSNQIHYVFQHVHRGIGEAKHQLQIRVLGNQVVYFHPQFSIPDSFDDWLNTQNDTMLNMSKLSLAMLAFMGLAMIVFMVIYRKQVTYQHGWILTLIFLVTNALHVMNMSPAFKVENINTSNPEFFVILDTIVSIFFTAIMGIFVYLSIGSGHAMWRVERQQLWPHWRDDHYGHHIMASMRIGYVFAPLILILQTIIFIIGNEVFDIWSVNDPLHSVYNLSSPVLFPLLAWTAAISEEAIYRWFGIILFKSIFRNTFVAILLSSIVWALGHVQYPVYPVYTRLIEVTILGMVFGYIFIKHGFFSAVFTHALVNSVLMGISLITTFSGWGYMLMSSLFVIIPLIVAGLIFWLHSRRRRNDRIILQS